MAISRPRGGHTAPLLATVVVLLGGVTAAACNALTGVSDLQTTDDGAGSSGTSGASGTSGTSGTSGSSGSSGTSGGVDSSLPPEVPPLLAGFAYRRTITLASDAPGPLAKHPVLVVLPPGFDAGHAKPAGDDYRFRVAGGATDLPYFIEDVVGGGSTSPRHVWVNLAAVPPGASRVYLFYGNGAALPASSFDATFPRVMRTAGGGAGDFTPAGDIDVDWFELAAGDTLTLPAQKALRITASRVVIAGNVEGNARGFLPGASGAAGGGPGGGGVAASDGAGGGGYGGAGGAGGADTAAGGAGGVVNGTGNADDLSMGSAGGSTSRPGGAGGGAITVMGWRSTIKGRVRVNGDSGNGGAAGQCSGGGSGGGILLAAWQLDLAGAILEAKGARGGNPLDVPADGGGGGGGGRIKLRARPKGAFVAAATMDVGGGGGGAGGGSAAEGKPGAPGTTNTIEASTLATGVESSLGPEEKVE